MSTNSVAQYYRIRSLLIQVVLLSFILLLSPHRQGQAASTIVVNSTEDVARNDGTCTLREAVIAANRDRPSGGRPNECIAGSGADTILLPAGVYTITRSDSGNENSSSTGDLDILDDLALVGDGADVTIIEGIDIHDRIVHVLDGAVSISGVTLSGGNVPQSGGGIYNEASLSLMNVIVADNHAEENGGGVYNNGTLTMTMSAVVSNTAVLDSHELINNGTATINNSTISGHGLGSSGTTDLSFVTVVGETAVSSGTFNAHNSIFTACTGTISSQGYNLIADTTDCTISGDLSGNILDQDPVLDVLAVNSGPIPTLTHALLKNSPAIESGSNASCPVTDQRGIARPIGAFCDIGAYENENPLQNGDVVVVNTDDDDDDGECSYLHCTLREAINATNGNANTIGFNISGTITVTIQPTSALPILNQPVTLDGTTQPGGTVILDGSLAGAGANGLTLAGGDSFVRGLVITNFDCNGLVLQGAGNNVIEDNSITSNGCHGVQVLSGTGNTIVGNSISANGLLGIGLEDDSVTTNDIGDGDSGANDKQNFPVLTGAVANSSNTLVSGRLNSTADTTFTLEFFSNSSCDISNFGEGEHSLGTAVVTTDSNGNARFAENLATPGSGHQFVTATATYTDLDTNSFGSTSELSQCVVIGPKNDSWPNALALAVVPDLPATAVQQYLDQQNQSRWYKFTVQPNGRLIVSLTGLPANYDLTVYKDIGAAFANPQSNLDLALLGAEFAPDAFSPDAFSPDAFSPDAFSPDAFSPDAFSPDAFSPDAFSPDAFSPDAFSPDAFSPDAFSPDAFSPDAFSPDAFSPDAFSPDAFSPDAFSPDAFSSAQTRSLIAISAFEGAASEGVSLNTWNNATDFYIRVRGRQGAFTLASPFNLEVQLISNGCGNVSSALPDSSTTPMAGGYQTIILTDFPRMEGYGSSDQLDLAARLADFIDEPEVAGIVVDLSIDDKVLAANAQADANAACPYAKNLAADAIKEIIDGYRALNPDLRYIVLLGNDDTIPFYRYPDQAMLANEKNYVPPVLDFTASQASLKLGYILTQDAYGASLSVSSKTNELPIPDLAVGRLVETMADATIMLDAYLNGTNNGTVPTPNSAFVSGYDFLEDGAKAVEYELEEGMGTVAETLILPNTVSPSDPLAWTADDLAANLFSSRHDLVFLAAHFSANSMLAADYSSRLVTDDLLNSPTDFTNSIVFSAGCHAGYNIVNDHAIPQVTEPLDWPQAFAQKGATLIAGSGYQYGDTDFIEYSERLYLLFSQQLRTGTDAVTVGEALVAAKQAYLATTPEMRGIHEKSLLEATLFGLPMLSVDMPGNRLMATGTSSIVPGTTTFGTDPGAELGLTYADVSLPLALTAHTVIMSDVATLAPVTATYFSGPDGVMSNPAEPALPLSVNDVTVPGTVLRGVGFRGGSYEDVTDVLPFTGAATTEIRGVHAPFLTDVFYPVKLWQPNYFGVLTDPDQGPTRLMVTPAHYKSTTSGAPLGTMRHFSGMDFRLYYSHNFAAYADGSVPALASAPTIVWVTAVPDDGNLHFTATVNGNPAAGVQEVWVTYTDNSAAYPRQWQSLDLIQDPLNSALWTASLPLNGTPAEEIQYMIQAVNGVGLVSLDTNQGAYYGVGGDAPVPNADPTTLTLELLSSSGVYGSQATFSAVLSSNGTLLADHQIFFNLGSQSKQAVTDASGRATVTISLLGLPGDYQAQAFFAGTGQYLAATDSAAFWITKQPTTLTLEPEPAAGEVIAILKAGERRLAEKSVFFVVTGSEGSMSAVVITDNQGEAVLNNLMLPAGTYNVMAYFSGVIPLHTGVTVTLDDDRYLPSTTSGTLTQPNTPPQAVDDAYSTDEDALLSIAAPGVLDNDGDVNGDDLTAVLVADVSYGTLTLNADGSFSYLPQANFNGSDSFTYRADDGADESDLATVTISVNAVNDAPVAVNDGYSVVTGDSLTVNVPGVLGNDSDEEDDGLTAVLQDGPNDGALSLSSDGSFIYTPDLGFVGDDSFTYQAYDGVSFSIVATVAITVLPSNTAPDCSGATSSVTFIWPPDKRFVAVNILGVTDADGDPITITIDSIFQDEKVGHGNNSPDGMGIGTDMAYVRAERAGNGNGRVYHIGFTASDGQDSCSSDLLRLPVVDHDQNGEEIDAIDEGPLYDSTQSS